MLVLNKTNKSIELTQLIEEFASTKGNWKFGDKLVLRLAFKMGHKTDEMLDLSELKSNGISSDDEHDFLIDNARGVFWLQKVYDKERKA